MDISSLKDLKNLLRLCRKEGVSDIEISGIKMHLGPISDYGAKKLKTSHINSLELPPEASVRVPTYTPMPLQEQRNEAVEHVEMPDELSTEQILFYSAKGEPQ